MIATPSPPSTSTVREWLSRHAPAAGGRWRVGAPMGDVSSRKYFRARDPEGDSLVVAWYPPSAAESYSRYRSATLLLEAAGIRTPKIVAVDAERRFMALEDVGDRRLFDLPPGVGNQRLYERAIQIADRISRLPAAEVAALNPPIDRGLLQRELDQTWDLFLAPLVPPDEQEATRAELAALCRAIAEEPLDPCHRDFMSRNLMLEGEGDDVRLVVIDHQDLRLGPRGYDFASLLHDSCRLTADQTERLEACLEGTHDDAFHRLVAQRSLKIVGTFHAFAARGTPAYLPMVPEALETAAAHLSRVPAHRELARRLRDRALRAASGSRIPSS